MRLDNEKVRAEKLYRVGYIACLDQYVLASVVTWVVWYDRFFEITQEEYRLFESDISKLDALANELREQGERSERFLFSDKKEENSAEQALLRQKCANFTGEQS